MKQALNLPKKIYFKTGSAPVALRELSDIYHCNRALLITDPKLYLAGVAAPVVDQLRHQGIRVAEYFTIGETVSYEDLRGALPKLNEFQPDVILGVGGENALSAAKALLALYVDSELDLTAAADDSHLIPACDKAKLVLIAADCTSGAQTSPFAVLKDDEGEIRVLKSIYLLPELSITDADFTQWLTAEGPLLRGPYLSGPQLHRIYQRFAGGCHFSAAERHESRHARQSRRQGTSTQCGGTGRRGLWQCVGHCDNGSAQFSHQ